jgi:predicted nucleic acid-binding protein
MRPLELLVDTSYAVALVSRGDQYHNAAQHLAARYRARAKLVITQAVCLEIGNSLAKRRNRPDAVRLLTGIQRDPGVVIVPMSDGLYSEALTVNLEDPDAEPVETALALSPAAAENGNPRKKSFADAVRRLRIDGPPDWSERVDHYPGCDRSDAAI